MRARTRSVEVSVQENVLIDEAKGFYETSPTLGKSALIEDATWVIADGRRVVAHTTYGCDD